MTIPTGWYVVKAVRLAAGEVLGDAPRARAFDPRGDPRRVAALLARHLRPAARPGGPVFPRTVPEDRGPRRPLGVMRDRNYIGRRLAADLALLGFRHRQGHDLRRTFITLGREGGADKDLLSRATHRPGGDIMEVYTSVPWERLCAEVAKLRVERRKPPKIHALHSASCCNRLLQDEEEARKVAGLESRGVGNRTYFE
jgi:integrase